MDLIMNYINEIIIVAVGLIALTFAITFMHIIKLKKLIAIIVSAIIVVATVGVVGFQFLSKPKVNSQQENINYMASYLIELEEYDIAMDYMIQNESDNEVLQQLIILDFALDNNISLACEKADNYIFTYDKGKDIVEDIRTASLEKEKKVRKQKLVEIHSEIKKNINGSVDQKTMDSMEVVLNKNHGNSVSSSELANAVNMLSKSEDASIMKAVAIADASAGQSIVDVAMQVVEKDDSLVNKVFAANAVATSTVSSDDSEYKKLTKEIADLEKEIAELEAKLKLNKTDDLDKKINSNKKKYEEAKALLDNLNIVRAEKYLEYSTNSDEKDTPLYKSEIATLKYMKGETTDAEQELKNSINSVIQDGSSKTGSTAILLMMDAYTDKDTNNSSSSSKEKTTISDSAKKKYMTQQLTQGIIDEEDLSYEKESIVEHLEDSLKDNKKSLLISNIGTEDFDNYYVDVYLNMANNSSTKYTLEDFTVYDSGSKVEDLQLLVGGETQKANICFVMDISGSMSGSSIVNAKKSAVNFLASAPSGSEVALVAFESSAKTEARLTSSTGAVSAAIDSLYAGGGTDISSGLTEAMNVLKGTTGRKIVILMTDGEDCSSSQNQIESVISKLVAEDIIVYAVGFGSAQESYLENIASKCNGLYVGADDSSNLASVYALFNKYISNDYHLRYKVTTNLQDFDRKVKIYCDGQYVYEKNYTVGITKDDIDKEDASPRTNFLYQVGGTNVNASQKNNTQ